MEEKDPNDKVITAVKAKLAGQYPNQQLKVDVETKVEDFLDGSLFFVNLYLTQGKVLYYVFLRGNEVTIITDISQLANIMRIYRPERSSQKLVGYLTSAPGIAAIIAILVLGTIIYLVAYKGVMDPPDILSGAFTTVLGFYFGSLTKR